jgi:hypothetical protein
MKDFLKIGIEKQKETIVFTKNHPVLFVITMTILLLVQQNYN